MSRLCELWFFYDTDGVLKLSLKMTLIKLEINKLTEQHLCSVERGKDVLITRCRDFIWREFTHSAHPRWLSRLALVLQSSILLEFSSLKFLVWFPWTLQFISACIRYILCYRQILNVTVRYFYLHHRSADIWNLIGQEMIAFLWHNRKWMLMCSFYSNMVLLL